MEKALERVAEQILSFDEASMSSLRLRVVYLAYTPRGYHSVLPGKVGPLYG